MLGSVLLNVRILRRRQEVGKIGWLLGLETVVVDHSQAYVHSGHCCCIDALRSRRTNRPLLMDFRNVTAVPAGCDHPDSIGISQQSVAYMY